MSDALFDAAVAAITGPDPEPTDAPTEPASAPTPDAPAPAAEPAPVEAPTPVVDEEKALLADLEARRQARQARQPQQPSSEVAELKAQLQALQAKFEQPKDLRQLIAQHGEVEGLRQYGIDPLEFFAGFRKIAKEKNPEIFEYKRTAEEAKAKAEALEQREQARQQHEAERQRIDAVRASERAFLAVTDDPATKLEWLPKMEPAARLQRTYAKIDALQREGYDTDALTDHQLAKLVDMDVRDEIRRLTGTDPGAAPPTNVPKTDGATAKPTPASLTNDLASQSTGGMRHGSEEERRAAAIRIIEQGLAEA